MVRLEGNWVGTGLEEREVHLAISLEEVWLSDIFAETDLIFDGPNRIFSVDLDHLQDIIERSGHKVHFGAARGKMIGTRSPPNIDTIFMQVDS